MKRLILVGVLMALCISPVAYAQFGATGTTTLSVNVGAEAAIQINTATTNLTTGSAIFGSAYSGTTNFAYKMRTTKVGGSGNITLQVTTDFGPAGGPSVATPPTAGDALTYTCTSAASGTPCVGSLTASTSAATNVVGFGADAKSTGAGDAGTVVWSLTDDPAYSTGAYTATVTFSISAV